MNRPLTLRDAVIEVTTPPASRRFTGSPSWPRSPMHAPDREHEQEQEHLDLAGAVALAHELFPGVVERIERAIV